MNSISALQLRFAQPVTWTNQGNGLAKITKTSKQSSCLPISQGPPSIGAGNMGAQIAAHLANVGNPIAPDWTSFQTNCCPRAEAAG